MKITALVLFVLMYILMITRPKYRPFYALAVAVIFVAAGIVPVDSLPDAINWNVLMMISGTMIIVHYFIDSHMPSLLADILLGKAGTVRGATILMSVFTGVISAFIDNVATVLMVAPVGMAICKKLKINPIGMILSIAVSSNLQGAATLVGDTTSIMLEPCLLYFGLLSGATLGGSLTPVGASANITAVGLLRKEGYHVSFGQFMKIDIPYTLAAVMTGYLYFWYIWR